METLEHSMTSSTCASVFYRKSAFFPFVDMIATGHRLHLQSGFYWKSDYSVPFNSSGTNKLIQYFHAPSLQAKGIREHLG